MFVFGKQKLKITLSGVVVNVTYYSWYTGGK